jgi:hypothetical protein
VTAATAFAIFQTIVMALVALAWGRLLAAGTGTTSIKGPATERVLHGIEDPDGYIIAFGGRPPARSPSQESPRA